MFKRNSVWLLTKIALLVSLVGLFMSSGCSDKTPEMQSHWSVEKVKVDGQLEDWADIPLTYFEDSEVSLGLQNDARNLHILLCFENSNLVRLIRFAGVTIWMDNTGRKRKDLGIRYTGGPSLSEMQKQGMIGEGGFPGRLPPEERERIMQEREASAAQITVIDKEKNQEIILPANGFRGPAVCSGVPQGVYTYEFCIPLQKNDEIYCAIEAQPGQTISLGFEWGLSRDELQNMMRERMGDRGGIPRGGMPGGSQRPGGGGMGRGGTRGTRGQLPEKQEVWVKTLLASPQKE